MKFMWPYAFLLLIPLCCYIFWSLMKRKRGGVGYSLTHSLPRRRTWRTLAAHFTEPTLETLIFISLIIALARPYTQDEKQEIKREGVNMVLTIDTSGSMEVPDFSISGSRANRLQAVQYVLKDFIEKRNQDRMGMVVYGSYASTIAPLTFDTDVLKRLLSELRVGMTGRSTAIGEALAISVRRLKDVEGKEKVVVLLTDGVNEENRVDPLTAVELAKTIGVRVYTIGVGAQLDIRLLRKIADETGGKFFNAQDTNTLASIYDAIDKLEKVKIKNTVFGAKHEKHVPFILFALILTLLLSLFRVTPLRRLSV